MATKEIERKIAVIFATDVVGYSKSVEKNEDQTIKNFRACKKILEDLFKEHDGRIFNTAGDSVLAEFSSAVSAVICATEFQRLIQERNESETSDLKMEFRIGINMGDVVVEGDNLYGDGSTLLHVWKLLHNQMEYVFQGVFMNLLIKSWISCFMLWVSKL